MFCIQMGEAIWGGTVSFLAFHRVTYSLFLMVALVMHVKTSTNIFSINTVLVIVFMCE